jgi:hypothetical protein
VLRGYLANAKRVRVRGVELDSTARVHPILALCSAVAYTDGLYITFRDAPAPLKDTGGPQSKDISGSLLPRHLEVGGIGRGRVCARTIDSRPKRSRVWCGGRQLSVRIFVECDVLAVPRR